MRPRIFEISWVKAQVQDGIRERAGEVFGMEGVGGESDRGARFETLGPMIIPMTISPTRPGNPMVLKARPET